MGDVDATNRPRAYLTRVSPDYVETIGLRLDRRPRVRSDRSRRERHERDGDVGAGAALLAGPERDRPPHQERRSAPSNNPVVDDRRRAAGREPARHPAEPDQRPRHLPAVQRALARLRGVAASTSGDPAALIKPATDLMRRREAGIAVFAAQPLDRARRSAARGQPVPDLADRRVCRRRR